MQLSVMLRMLTVEGNVLLLIARYIVMSTREDLCFY